MNKKQSAYIAAKAQCDAIVAEVDKALEVAGVAIFSDEWITEGEKLFAQFGYEAAHSALVAAEEAMLEWAYKLVKRSRNCVGQYAKAHDFCYQNRQLGSLRPELIQAALTL